VGTKELEKQLRKFNFVKFVCTIHSFQIMRIHNSYNFDFSGRRMFLLIFFTFYLSVLFAQDSELMYGDQIEQGTEIYVITNRLADTSASDLQYTNNLHSGSQLTYIRAAFYDIDSIQKLKIDSSQFLSEISEKPNDWLLFVLGEGKTLNCAIERGLDIQYLYDMPVIVFSWRSYDSEINGLENVKNSQQNVIKSTEVFFELLKFIEVFRQTNPSSQQEQSSHSLRTALAIII